MNLTYEEAHRLFLYNPDTGIITRKVQRRKYKKGSQVGGLNNYGYLMTRISGEDVSVHRLAWFMTHGVWPVELDHKDRVRHNNRLKNLREATRSVNCHNRASWGEVPAKGVCKHGNKFKARVTVNGKRLYLGLFDTLELAVKAQKEVPNYEL